jgi:hypothetical protein
VVLHEFIKTLIILKIPEFQVLSGVGVTFIFGRFFILQICEGDLIMTETTGGIHRR